MKRLIKLFLLVVFFTSITALAQAQEETDVTSYIQNVGFDADLTFQADGTMKEAISDTTSLSDRSWAYIAADGTVYARPKESSSQSRSDGRKMEAVNGFRGNIQGWEMETNSTFPYCEWVYFGSVSYNLSADAVPISDDGNTFLTVPEIPTAFDGGEGFVYMRAGWANQAIYKQTVNLPSGVYRLEYWTININSSASAIATDLTQVTCGSEVFKDESIEDLLSQEWTKHVVEFTSTGETTFQFGFQAANAGSGSNPILCVDGIKLIQVSDTDTGSSVSLTVEGNGSVTLTVIEVTGGPGENYLAQPGSPVEVQLTEGQTVQLTMMPDMEATLMDLTVNGASVLGDVDDNTYFLQDTSVDQNVVATFSGTAASSHTITVSSYGGGYVMESNSGTQVRDTDTPFTVDDGTSVTFTFVPDEGYYVQSAIVGDSLDITTDAQSGIYTFDTVGSDETLFVQFARFTLPLTVTNNGQGSTHIDVIEDSLTTRQVEVAAAASMTLQDDEGIPQGAKLVFTFQPETGYQLTGLRRDTTSILAQVDDNSYTIASYDFDQTITATYEAIPVYHTLTLTAGNNGSIVYINNNGDSITVQGGVQQSFEVAEGTQVPLRFVPSEGYYIGKAMMGVTTQTDITAQIDSQGYYVTEAMTEPTAVSATFYYEWTEEQRQQLMAARDSLTQQLTQADNLLAATDRPWNKSQLQQVRDSVSASAEGLLTVIDSEGNVVSPDTFDATTAQQIVSTTRSLAATLQQAQATFVNTNQPYVTLVATIAEAEAALSNEAYAMHDRTELEQALAAAQQLVAAATDVPQTDEFTTANQQLAAAITAFVQAQDLYTYTVHYVNGRAWTQVYAYTWISGDTGIAEPSGAWPGTQLTQKRDTIVNGQTYELYTYSLTAAQAPANIIFSDGGSNQTADLSFMQGHTYLDDMPQEFTMSFVNAPGWESVYAYTWRFADTFVEYSGAFPGVELTERTDTVVAGQTYGLYTYRLLGFEQPANIIFSNGQQGVMDYQTPDLEFQNGQTAVAYRLGVTSAGSGTVALDSVDMLVEPGYFGRIFNAADSHTLRFTPAEHYRIDTLTVNGADYLPYLTAEQTGGNAQSLTLNFDANQIVYVHFGRTMHTLTLNATEHGSITYDSLTVRNGERQVLVADGAAISVTVLADDDCYVALLTDNGTDVLSQLTESGTYTIASVTGDITLAATFAENDVTPYAVLSDSSTVLTFYYDRKSEERGGLSVGPFANEGYVPWYSARESITSVVFDDSFSDYTSLTSTAFWFCGMSNLATITGLEKLNTENVTDMNSMFVALPNLTELNVSSFNTANVTTMSRMFDGCSGLTTLDLNSFNTANVTSMDRMFYDCTSLTSLDLSSFNTANVTTMYCMFFNCPSLTSLNLSSFNTGNVTNMNGMFYRCSSLPSIDVSLFNTEKVTDLASMFQNCSNLTTLDLSSFNTASVSSMELMFRDCPNLTTIFAGDSWTTNNVTSATEGASVFLNCTALVGGEGTTYDANHTDHTYARIDGGAEAPGYFTAKGDTIVHTVHIVADGNGTVAVGEQTIRNGETELTVKNGRSSTLIIQPDTHYYVDQLTVNGDDRLSELADTTFTLTSISAATSVYVHFAQIMHTLTVSVSEHGALVGFNEETGDSVRLTNQTVQYSVGEGAVIPMQAVPDAGYHLGALTINGADAMSSIDNDGKFVLPEMTGDVTVVATFGQSFLPFSIDASGNGVAVFNGTVIRGTTTTFQVPVGSTAKVYVKADKFNAIDYVYANGGFFDVVNDTVTITNITDTMTLDVCFVPLLVPLTITSEGQGTVGGLGPEVFLAEPGTYETSIEFGHSATYVFRPAEHYVIDSLSVNGISRLTNLSVEYHLTLDSIADVTSIYVRFAQIMHTLTLNAQGQGYINYSEELRNTEQSYQVAEGDSVSLTIAADAGYHIGSATMNGSDISQLIDADNRFSLRMDGDVTIAAVFGQTFVPLTVSVTGNGRVNYAGTDVRAGEPQTFQVGQGQQLQIAVVADEYNELSELLVNGESRGINNDTLYIEANEALTVEARFVRTVHYIEIASIGDGSVTLDTTTVSNTDGQQVPVYAGTQPVLYFAPAAHHAIDSLSVDGISRRAELVAEQDSTGVTGRQTLTLETVTADRQLFVSFAQIMHTLTLNAQGQGYINYSEELRNTEQSYQVAEGDSVSLTIAADAGYHIGSATMNGSDISQLIDADNRFSLRMDGDVTIAAVFGQTFVPLTVSVTGNGMVAYNGAELRDSTATYQVSEGGTAHMVVRADQHNRLATVLVNGTATELVNDTLAVSNITAETSVEVAFEPIMHNITLRSWGYGTTVADSLSLTGNRDGDVELRNERRMAEGQTTMAEGSTINLILIPEQDYRVQRVLVIGDNATDTIAASRLQAGNVGYRLLTDSLLADVTIDVSYVWDTDSLLIDQTRQELLSATEMTQFVLAETESYPWYRNHTRDIVNFVVLKIDQLAEQLERNSHDEGPGSSDPMPSRPVVESLVGEIADTKLTLQAAYDQYTAVNVVYVQLTNLIDEARSTLTDEQYIHSEPEPLQLAINLADSLVQQTGEEPETEAFEAMLDQLQAAIDEFRVPRYQLLLVSNGYGIVVCDTTATRQQAERWLRQDTELTLTFVADEGYHLDMLTLNGSDAMSQLDSLGRLGITMTEATEVEAVFELNTAGYDHFIVDGVTYQLNSLLADETRVTAVAMTDFEHAVIPSHVYYDGRQWQVVALSDTLFNAVPSLISVQFGATVERVSSTAFANNPRLSAIDWQGSTPLALEGIDNDNLLVYVQDAALAPEGVRNVVVGDVAEEIILSDDRSSKGGFWVIRPFTARTISYTHNYTLTTPLDGCQGWETLALPFDVETITHATKGAIEPFARGNAEAKHFWLYGLGAAGFEREADIRAYMPYVISMPNNRAYSEDMRLNGRVTFAAQNARMEGRVGQMQQSGNVALTASMMYVQQRNDIFALNISGEMDQPAGSIFGAGIRDILPFQAYATYDGGNAPRMIPLQQLFDGEDTAIDDIACDLGGNPADGLYDLGGRKVSAEKVSAGKVRKGVYVRNGRKQVVKNIKH